MDWLTFILEVLKFTIPAVVVGGAMYLVTRSFLDREHKRRLLELRMKNAETALPIRLQAYERICLFLERITPSNLLIRIGSPALSAPEFHRLLLTEIRNEYNHNVSQQMYMSEQAWVHVKKAKEDVVTLINKSYQHTNERSKGTDLAKRVLETVITEEIDPTSRALEFLKREISQLY